MTFKRILVTQLQYGSVKSQMSEEVWLARIAEARKMAHACKQFGVTLVGVTDDKSMSHFADTGAQLINTPVRGIGPARRVGFNRAVDLLGSNPGAIGWSEPEKVLLPVDIERICQPIEEDKADLVIPCRTAEGIESYPTPQIPWEYLGNYWCSIIFGSKFPLMQRDQFFAPIFFSSAAARFFTEYPGDQPMPAGMPWPDLWDSIFCPRMDAFCSGFRFAEVQTNFLYPDAQAKMEAADYTILPKRSFAFHNIVSSLVERRRLWENLGFDFGPAQL